MGVNSFDLLIGPHMDVRYSRTTFLHNNVLRSELVDWFIEHQIPYCFQPKLATVIIDDPRHAMLFKLVWM